MLRPIWQMPMFTAPTEAGEPEPEPSEGVYHDYYRNRRLRRWKAFKPKDRET
jgi:hypothetical protein